MNCEVSWKRNWDYIEKQTNCYNFTFYTFSLVGGHSDPLLCQSPLVSGPLLLRFQGMVGTKPILQMYVTKMKVYLPMEIGISGPSYSCFQKSWASWDTLIFNLHKNYKESIVKKGIFETQQKIKKVRRLNYYNTTCCLVEIFNGRGKLQYINTFLNKGIIYLFRNRYNWQSNDNTINQNQTFLLIVNLA